MAAASAPKMGVHAEEPRDRLELEDFEVSSAGGHFDSVLWLNARLAKSGVAFDKLDQHLSSLAMRCQLLCQDTSESIEVASNQLVTQLPATGRDLERMRGQALRGRDQLGGLLTGMRDADDRKQSGLQGLAEIDAVKTRVETACSALREVGSWERKVRDCEQLIHAGKLPAALQQLASLKGVLDAFRMLPEYTKKEGQLSQLEENLLATARRRARQAVERNVVADLGACGEVFVSMQRKTELAGIAEAVFAEVAEKAWQGQDPRSDTSAGALAVATRAVFEAVAQAFRERWPLLQALDEQVGVGAEDTAGAAATAGAEGNAQAAAPAAAGAAGVAAAQGGQAASTLALAVRASLSILREKLENSLPKAGSEDTVVTLEEVAAHTRASRAVALLAEYADGFSALAQCALMAETPGLWAQALAEALPWGLLREIARFIIWRPMQDAAMALAPAVHGQARPSDAILEAESNAKKLIQMPPTWARYLEEKGGHRLAPVWMACIDATCEAYWKQWDGFVAVFQNALVASRAPSGGSTQDCSHDASLLGEFMQLHSMLHDTLSAQFLAFRKQALQLAVRMYAAEETPLGCAFAEKMKDTSVWCESLGMPSAEALRSAGSVLEGLSPESAMLVAQATRALPLSVIALGKVEKQARDLVTQCCVQPVIEVLAAYAEMKEWSRAESAADPPLLAGGLSPLPCITAVGEHLFALVPQLERSHEGGPQVQWLPAILESVVETTTQRLLQIRQLSLVGTQQLVADLEYLHKVTDALGSGAAEQQRPGGASCEAAAKLGETLEVLKYLATQQRQHREHAAKGQVFAEPPREVPALARRTERALRTAMGLGPGLGA